MLRHGTSACAGGTDVPSINLCGRLADDDQAHDDDGLLGALVG
jgi:hypothetical protein